MEHIPASGWQNSPGINHAGKIFVARFRELTHPFTIDIYRVRYLNARLASAELTETICAVQEKRIDTANVRDLAAETKRLLEEEGFVEGLVPDRQFLYGALVAPFIDQKESQVHPGLEIIVRSLTDRLEARYGEAIVGELRRSIERDEPALSNELSGTLATDLLGRGYDIRHLYAAANSFLAPPAVPFRERLERFLTELYPQTPRTFKVIFRLVFHKPMNPFPRSVAGIDLQEVIVDPNLNPREAGFLRKRPTWRYSSLENISALDPFSASKIAHAAVSRGLDLLQLAEPSAQVSIYPTSLILEQGRPHLVSLANRVLGPPRLARDWLAGVDARFRAVQKAAHIPEQTHARISSGLRYLRMGLTDDMTEGQFLNLWIGLESLFARPGRSPIEPIRHGLPNLLTYRYASWLLLDLRENLIRCKALPGEPLLSDICRRPDKHQQLERLWAALRDADQKMQLLSAAADHPLLQSRIEDTSRALETSDQVLRAITRHKTDVTWHLQRMYRVRNRIVHEGGTITDLTLLGANIAAYLWTSLDELLGQLSRHQALRTIEDVVNKIDTTVARLEESLRQDANNAIPLIVVIDPDRQWP